MREKVSTEDIKKTINAFLSYGGLHRDPETNQLIKEETSFLSREDIPSATLRTHHKQMLQRALESIDEQGVLERELISWVFSFKKSDLPALKQHLRNFRNSVDDKFYAKKGDCVYQLNLQLFEHTVEIEDQ